MLIFLCVVFLSLLGNSVAEEEARHKLPRCTSENINLHDSSSVKWVLLPDGSHLIKEVIYMYLYCFHRFVSDAIQALLLEKTFSS